MTLSASHHLIVSHWGAFLAESVATIFHKFEVEKIYL